MVVTLVSIMTLAKQLTMIEFTKMSTVITGCLILATVVKDAMWL